MSALRRLALLLLLALGALAPGTAHADDPARTPAVEFSLEGTSFAVDAAAGMGGFVDAVEAGVRESWAGVAARTGAPPGEHIAIHVEYELGDWFVRTGSPHVPPEWAAGLALPSRRIILLAPGNPEWESTLRHELSHVAMRIASGDNAVPRWLDEGFAMLTASQSGIDRATVLLQATMRGALHEFPELDRGWPAESARAQVAYAQSRHFVQWAERQWGDDVFRRVLVRVRNGEAFADAFRAETDTLLSVALQRWEAAAQVRFSTLPLGLGGGFAWGVAAVLITLAWRRRRRLREAAFRRMEERERRNYAPDPDDSVFG